METTSLEIDRMLTCCSSHVTQEDSEILEIPNGELVSHPYEYGWLVWTGNGFRPELSEAANKLLDFARKHGCEWLRIDGDGPTIDNLETFSW
jgi:hypothetical protein